MKTKLTLLLGLLACVHCLPAFAQGTAFTYQGRLNSTGAPASGNYDLAFTLFDSPGGGTSVGSLVLLTAVPVSNGLFTVTINANNEFGATAFNGSARWLEIGVRTNCACLLNFTTLTPRQPLTPTPYAIFAENVGIGGMSAGTNGNAVTFNNAANSFTGSHSGNGGGLTNVNAATLGGLSSSNFWKLGGNSGANPTNGNFLGTTDNLPLEFKVNGVRALRVEPNANGAPNLIAGSPRNVAAPGVFGATISGGGVVNYLGSSYSNSVADSFGTIAGGYANEIQAGSYESSIGGGSFNVIRSNSYQSVIAGGAFHFLGTNAIGATIGGGYGNAISNNAGGSIIAGGNFNVILDGSTISTIAGGSGNVIDANANYSTIGGGAVNYIFPGAQSATIGGGYRNIALGRGATVPGGYNNAAIGDYSLGAGRRAIAYHYGSFVWADYSVDADFRTTANNQFLIRAAGGVGIGTANPAAAVQIVSSNSSTPQLQLTQLVPNNFARLRMNVGGSQSWEMDVSSGPVPSVSWWNVSQRMVLDYNGNLTITGTYSPSSDRNRKEHFELVNTRDVLDKVTALPLTTWNFKEEATKHLGPMAQDFHAAFGLGPDDKHISTVDADGVALAAIQGLNEKVEVRSEKAEGRMQKLEEELKRRDAENAELKTRLANLERLIKNLNPKGN